MRFAEQQLYSPIADKELLRLSAWRNGGEYYVLIPVDDEGAALREARTRAQEALEQAVLQQPPGEVILPKAKRRPRQP